MPFKGDLDHYLRGTDLSHAVGHYRELASSGLISPETANTFSNWLMKVSALVEMTGQPFEVVASCVQAPWRGYTTSDGGSEVNPPTVIHIGTDGTDLDF